MYCFYRIKKTLALAIIAALICSGCSESEDTPKGEFIYRLHDEYLFVPPRPEKKAFPKYPWDNEIAQGIPKITKEYFRCKGCSLNPAKKIEKEGKVVTLSDCGGVNKHSLPLRDNKEFIYPILIDLLNYIQEKTGKKVIITSGHRCPEHNTYVDSSPSNSYSKHMIGAEVSFYVQGLEHQPERVINHLLSYYQGQPDYVFKRYEKGDTNVSIPPWYNKEVYIKLSMPCEGRNFDNQHPYPYISIQVRYDKDKQERVIYSWELANKNYFRK